MGDTRILIIGAGLTGLALASGLRIRGVDPVVVEQAPVLTEAGWVIGLTQRHFAALDQVGHADRSGWPTDRQGTMLWFDDGGNLQNVMNADEVLMLSRTDLQIALLDSVRELVRTGVRPVAAVDQGDRVEVEFDDGTHDAFDVVIGADGINSWTRRHVLHGPEAGYAGAAVIRFHIPNTDNLTVTCRASSADGALGYFLMNERKTMHCILSLPGPENNRRDLTLAQLAEPFSALEGPLRGVVTAMRDNPPHYYTNINQVPAGPWVSNRIGLIGDAAHAMSPLLGQGAGVGFEDAALLAELLTLPHTPVPLALRNYEHIRAPLARAVQAQSYAVTANPGTFADPNASHPPSRGDFP